MIYKTSEKGQALILVALAAVGLFAFSALAIDGSRSFSNKRNAQNAADTSALTAALVYAQTTGNADAKFAAAKDKAEDRAESNGFNPANPGNKTKVDVYVQRCSEPTDLQTGLTLVCDGLPAGITTAQKAEFIRVRIVSSIPTTFGRVLGRQTLTSAAEAIARVQGGTSGSSGTTTAGAAMVATNGEAKSHCFLFNGNATLVTHDSGVYINCSANDSFFLNGSTLYTMEADSYVVGCKDGNSGYRYTGGEIICDADPIVVGPDTYAYVPTMPNPPTCSTNGSITYNTDRSAATLRPGIFYGLTPDVPTTMEPGVYCVNGDFNINAHGSLKAPTGRVQIVTTGSLNWKNQANFNDLEVYTVNGNLDIKDHLDAKRLRFYSSGSGDSILNSGAYVEADDAYFYLHRGYINWNGSSHVKLTAPPDGDPFVGGILVHAPWENTSASNLNGGSNALIHGTFLMPHSKVTFNGGTNFELHSQIIAYEYILDGNGEIEIYYLSASIINPPSVMNPTIELTK